MDGRFFFTMNNKKILLKRGGFGVFQEATGRERLNLGECRVDFFRSQPAKHIVSDGSAVAEATGCVKHCEFPESRLCAVTSTPAVAQRPPDYGCTVPIGESVLQLVSREVRVRTYFAKMVQVTKIDEFDQFSEQTDRPSEKANYDGVWLNFTSVFQGRISLDGGIASTVEEMKALIQEKPLVFIYPVATPIETALSETEIAAYRALHSNYPNTTVLNDSGAHMVVKYAADTKLYIDNKIAALIGG